MSLFIGLSALRASQTGLDLISQNIANANTPGYHLQRLQLESLNDDLFQGRRFGNGVSVNDIQRIRQQVVESFITETTSDVNLVQQRLSVQQQLENLFLPGTGSLNESLDTFFNNIEALGTTPSDSTSRQEVIQEGQLLASRFREVGERLNSIRDAYQTQIESEVSELNDEIAQISELNRQIVIATASGGAPNGLLDQRDQLISSVAEKVNVSTDDLANGGINITFGNYSIASTSQEIRFASRTNADQSVEITLESGSRSLQVNSGRIAALVESYNETIPEYTAKLDELAAGLIQKFDQIHATGVGSDGPFSRLIGSRSTDYTNVRLAQAGTAFPVESGNLYLSITQPDGTRVTEAISIDVNSDSLEDIASRINSITGLASSINPQTNQIQITSVPGYSFDFTGSISTTPSLDSYTGTAIPEFSGLYNGATNTNYSFEVIGDGTVGITDGLALRVTDSNGNLVNEINIGNGYEAGTPISIADSVELTLPYGDVADGDTFSTELIANPDETGFLSATGLNSFFVGQDAATIGVAQRIIDNPQLFSTSTSEDAPASLKLQQYGNLKNTRVLSDNRLSLSEYLNDVSTDIGIQVSSSQRLEENLGALKEQYESERDSVSGVDVNEEIVRLTQYQNSYEAAVRVIQTSEAVLDELFSIIS